MKPLKLLYIIAVALLPTLASCGAHKQTSVPTYQPQASAVTGSDKQYDQSDSWQRLNVPVTLRLKEPKSISVSATATMERGRSVTLSLRFLGMEVGLLHLTSDSVVAIDKYNHRYVAEPLGQLLGGIPANISNLQDLLIGRPFILGKTECSTADFTIESNPSSGNSIMIPRTETKGFEYGFSLSPTMALSALIIKAAAGKPVTITYSEQASSPSGPVASATTVDATTPKSAIRATLDWNFGKAKWDNSVTIRAINIPSGYTRIPPASLLKLLSGF